MGLTGGVKSHRLSGQISPYCQKNVIGSARIARLCLVVGLGLRDATKNGCVGDYVLCGLVFG